MKQAKDVLLKTVAEWREIALSFSEKDKKVQEFLSTAIS